MACVSKRWFINPGRVRVFLAFLYLFVTFGIPLSHTCQPADNEVYNHHSEGTRHLLHSDSCVEVHHTATLNQNSLSEKADSHDMYCPACLFSLTSKAFKLCSNNSLCSTQTIVRTQVLPQLSFIKQFEWFCSAPLRAPPSIAS